MTTDEPEVSGMMKIR